MKHIAIINIFGYYLVEDIANGSITDNKMDELHERIRNLCREYGIEISGNETFFYGLEKFSIGNCDTCGKLMINRDRNPTGLGPEEPPESFSMVVLEGGEHDGSTLCEECLPFTHRWGCHS